MSFEVIAYSDWKFLIILPVKDGKLKHYADMSNQGHGGLLVYSPVWLNTYICHGWLPVQLVSWGKIEYIVWLGPHRQTLTLHIQ